MEKFCDLCDGDENYLVDQDTSKTEHQVLVERFLKGIGKTLPDKPQVPPTDSLKLSVSLNLEEVLELIEAAGFELTLNSEYSRYNPITIKDLVLTPVKTPDLIEMVDAYGDIVVVATGGLSRCGVADWPILDEIDSNNLMKVTNGKIDPVTGKLIKPEGHPAPQIDKLLKQQGWDGQ